jgi:hypothetical protein
MLRILSHWSAYFPTFNGTQSVICYKPHNCFCLIWDMNTHTSSSDSMWLQVVGRHLFLVSPSGTTFGFFTNWKEQARLHVSPAYSEGKNLSSSQSQNNCQKHIFFVIHRHSDLLSVWQFIFIIQSNLCSCCYLPHQKCHVPVWCASIPAVFMRYIFVWLVVRTFGAQCVQYMPHPHHYVLCYILIPSNICHIDHKWVTFLHIYHDSL